MSDFPEHLFGPVTDERLYRARIEAGRAFAEKRGAVIVGLARNVAAVLPTTIARIEATGALFGDYRVALFENDSEDGTQAALNEWAERNPRVAVQCEAHGRRLWGQVRNPERGTHMAQYRNRAKDLAHKVGGEGACCYIVVDTDLAGGWSLDGVLHSLSYWSQFDVMVANGLGVHHRRKELHYYDAWATRWKCWKPRHARLVRRTLKMYRGQEPRPLLSGFGGIAIYTAEAFSAGHYRGGDCEHVLFHQVLNHLRYGRLFANPSLIALNCPAEAAERVVARYHAEAG